MWCVGAGEAVWRLKKCKCTEKSEENMNRPIEQWHG